MSLLRRLRYAGQHRPGAPRPHAAWPPPADPWLAGEETRILPALGGAR
jgi:hypothetical protein